MQRCHLVCVRACVCVGGVALKWTAHWMSDYPLLEWFNIMRYLDHELCPSWMLSVWDIGLKDPCRFRWILADPLWTPAEPCGGWVCMIHYGWPVDLPGLLISHWKELWKSQNAAVGIRGWDILWSWHFRLCKPDKNGQACNVGSDYSTVPCRSTRTPLFFLGGGHHCQACQICSS